MDATGLFFSRAAEEAQRYGPDPWVFLRELVQNSRDARAHRIDVWVRTTDLEEEITVEDDGAGMSADVVERYLLRLYASTKVENGSVGYFGVGFWSVLRFEPRSITVVSRSGDETVGLAIDCRSTVVSTVLAARACLGTEVRIVRDAGSGPREPEGVHAVVRERLRLYAAHVRPFPGERKVELRLNGERLDCDFPTPRYGPRRITGTGFDAVVGFEPQPSVRIYTAGILVRAMTSLDEVIPSREAPAPRGGWGLYPVVYLNVEGLQVLMDRQTVFENQRLKDALHRCERELLSSHHRLLRGFLPLDLRNLWWSALGRIRLKPVAVVVALAVCAAALTVGIARLRPLSDRSSPLAPRALEAPRAVNEIEEALGSTPLPSAVGIARQPWDLLYDGPSEVIFIARFLTVLDPDRGFYAEPLRQEGPYPEYPDRGEGRIAVRMRVAGAQSLMVVPTPPGYVVAARSLRHNGVATELQRGAFGEALIPITSPGWVSYAVVPWQEEHACAPFLAEDLPWPDSIVPLLAAAMNDPPEMRVDILRRYVRESFVYGRTPLARGTGRWLHDAVTDGRGDCDVINGVMAALLRSAGIEAHLAVGIVGTGGRAAAPLHAAVVYCLDGWRILDLTTEVRADGLPDDAAGVWAPESPATAVPDAQKEHGWLAAVAASVLAGLGIAGGVVERNARRAQPDPSHVRYLFDHLHDASGLGDALCYRPVVPMLGGRRASLFQLERMAGRTGLFGARPGSPASEAARGHALIDRSSPLVEVLEPYLPPITWLDDPCWSDPPPYFLQRIETLLRTADDGIRIHLARGSKMIQCVSLRLRADNGRYHVLVGDLHPAVAEMEAEAGRGGAGVRVAAGILMRALPFYFHHAPESLAVVAHGMAGEGDPV